MPAPRMGNVVTSSIETRKIAHATRSQESDGTPELRLNCKVARKVIAPASDEAPRRCSDRIARETAFDELKSAPVSGK